MSTPQQRYFIAVGNGGRRITLSSLQLEYLRLLSADIIWALEPLASGAAIQPNSWTATINSLQRAGLIARRPLAAVHADNETHPDREPVIWQITEYGQHELEGCVLAGTMRRRQTPRHQRARPQHRRRA